MHQARPADQLVTRMATLETGIKQQQDQLDSKATQLKAVIAQLGEDLSQRCDILADSVQKTMDYVTQMA